MHKISSGVFPRWLLSVFAAALLVMLAGGAWFYLSQSRHYHQMATDDLMSIARLKSKQIAAWRSERLGDASILTESPFLAAPVAHYLATSTEKNKENLGRLFRSLQMHYGYADILLVDPEGRVHLSMSGNMTMHEGYRMALASALRDGSPVFTGLHTGKQHQKPHISVVAPLFSGERKNRSPLGAIILVSDASQFLSSLMQPWPAPNKSAETYLVTRLGNDVLYLTDLRHQPAAALKLRIPLTRTDLPAVMAVLGKQGVVEGKDYRGVEVMAAVLPVPGSPWFLVVKQDTAELYADWRIHMILFLLLFLALLGALGGIGLAAWQRRKKVYYLNLYRAEAKLCESVERHAITLQAIGDAVIATDFRGTVELLNPVAEELTGWSRSDAVGRPLHEVFRIISEETRLTVEDPVAKVLCAGTVVGLANHTLLIAKDGREIPIADSAAPIRDEQGEITGVVLVFRDQSEERRIQRLMEARLTLLEYATNHTLEELLTKALDEVGNLVSSPIGFYHFVAADQQTLSLQQWSSRTLNEFCRAEGRGLHYGLEQAGVWADCVREKQPVIHNDYESLPGKKGMPEGHAVVVRELVVPILREDRVVAILGVGNKPSDYTENDQHIVTYLADVTWEIVEQKRIEEALRESESFLGSLLNAIPIPVFFKDKEGRYRGFNRAFETFFGETREQLIGKSVFDINPPDLAEIYHAKDNELFESGGMQHYESQVKNAQGVVRDVIFNKAIFTDSQGIVKGLIGAILDITEIRQAEEALKESEGRVRAKLEAVLSPEGELGALDLADIIDVHAIQAIMDDFFRLTKIGVGVIDVSGKVLVATGWQDICTKFHRAHPEAYRNCIESDTLLTKGSKPGTFTAYKCKNNLWDISTPIVVGGKHKGNLFLGQFFYEDEAPDNEAFRVQARTYGFDEDEYLEALDRVPRWSRETVEYALSFYARFATLISTLSYSNLKLAQTLEERKRADAEREILQSQLNQAQKMESVGRLAGGVAHDFNNMLGVILGHTELALMKADPVQPLCSDLQEIRNAAERSAKLVRQLLAFARKETIAPKVLDLNETVEGMLTMLGRLIGEDIELAWLPGLRLWPVKMDPSQIDQILANLCVNARDAIGGVGKVTIETSNAVFDETNCAIHAGYFPGEFVLLAVSDDGCGMAKETQDNIFEPFFTTKEVGKGTGLGLATVFGIVKQNNGFIDVYSEPGQGTTFKIYLPRHSESACAPKSAAPEPVRRGHETILLVEDEAEILELGRMMLESFGYSVLAASTPGEAINCADEHAGEIDLLMTDVVMPGMNGRELAKKLMASCPNLTCLFMSGYTADVIAHRGVLDEGVHFIQKPFSMQQLSTKVRETLDKK
jgi:PAS domain S-box-containing protein